jgi:TonB family protein
MNWITANLDTNPLRVTLIFSVFLHVTGFYFLSGLTFDSAIRVPETIPITVRPLTEKKEIKPLEVARAPQPTRSKLAQSIHPVSVPQKEKVFPRPTPIHEKRNRIQPNRIIPQAQFPRDLDRVSLTSIENLSSSPTRSQSRSRQAISMAVPRGPQSNHLSQENSSFSVKSTEVLVASTEEILQTDSLQARAASGSKFNIPQTFPPTLAVSERPQDQSIAFTPQVRAASGSKFDTSQTFPPTLAVSERPQDRDTVFTSQARAASNIKIDVPQKFTPARLLANRDGGGNNRFTPTVRTAALASGFTEESLEAPKATDTAKSTPPGFDRFSALEIGKLRQGFRKQIRHKVGKAKYYPKMARRLGFEGKPVVSFTLGFKGELLDLKLVQASTYNLLNEAALETIRRGTPYPPIPGPLGKKSISFDLPILYTLED